jgi:hypothetical protein
MAARFDKPSRRHSRRFLHGAPDVLRRFGAIVTAKPTKRLDSPAGTGYTAPTNRDAAFASPAPR